MSTLSFITQWVVLNLKESFESYLKLYLIIITIASIIVVRANGPVKNQKILKVIELIIKMISILFIICGVSDFKIFTSMFASLFFFNLLFKAMNSMFLNNINNRVWPKMYKFLTLDEYSKEANYFTQIKLNELINFCKSPECDAWEIISNLLKPKRYRI